MEKSHATVVPVALSLLAALLLAGCGVTEGTVPPPTPSNPTQPPPVASGAGSITISPEYAAVAPGQQVQFSASSSSAGAIEWLVNGVQGGSAATGTINASGDYTAPASLSQSADITITAALTTAPQQDYANAVASVIDPGVIYPTSNPQVDEYSIYLPAPGKVSVQFGTTTAYGLNTWQVPTPSPNGGAVTIYVAGMLGQTLYHMRAQVVLNDGATYNDVDHDTFVSGAPLKTGIPPSTAPMTVTSSGTPEPGIELWNTIIPQGDTQAFATDMKGNVIWTYSYQGSVIDLVQGVQMLPNDDFLMVISYLSSLTPGYVALHPGTLNLVREVDLAGNTVKQITMDQLNQRLAAAGFHRADGSPYQLRSFHHDVLPLPNGHWVLLADEDKTYTNLPGYPGSKTVVGDVLVDVDKNLNPDWVWSTFDHLNINRHPMYFPDWTHGNDMLYSTDDHDLLFSMRHQNWVIKIAFDDGKGSGNILWRLGEGGDFQLLDSNGQPDNNPADWFYGQHGMDYFTQNTTGVFRLGVMDNGNDRIFPPPVGQVLCRPYSAPNADCYSTFPVLEINEGNMTARLVTHYVLPPSDFSFFGGNVEPLANGDMQADFCARLAGSLVQELNPSATQVVWQAITPKANQFRVDHLGSLYPGVQW